MWIAATASRCWKKPVVNCCSCACAASASPLLYNPTLALYFLAVNLKEAGLSNADLAAKTRDELRTLLAVTARLREAEIQLTAYRETLKRTNGAAFEPRTHAMVCIGLERLVW